MSNLYLYNTDLRSMTAGSGSFSFHFARYEQAPGDIQNIVIQEAKERETEEA
jgi:elongation factor EF2